MKPAMMSSSERRGLVVGLALVVLLVSGMQDPLIVRTLAAVEAQDQVDILLVLDNDYGGNVPPIITIFERYGWNVTTTGLYATLYSCAYLSESMEVDILIPEIGDVTVFDAVSVMPGESHDGLRANQTALDLIRDAMSENLVVSAWCKAVRVLATADVIDGKNITGSSEFESEYVAAGATFNELVPPVIDGNLVTGVRSRFYRDEMCQAIATVLGFYEPDPPALDSIDLTPEQGITGANLSLEVHLSDATAVYMATVKVFELNASGLKASDVQVLHLWLDPVGDAGDYGVTITPLDVGNYTIDVYAWDTFMNEVEYAYAHNFTVREPPTTSSSGTPLSALILPLGVTAAAGVVIVIVAIVRRR